MALYDESRHDYLTAEQKEIARSYKPQYQPYEEELEVLKQWAEKAGHFPTLTHSQIFMFLRCTEYSMEAAKPILDRHFTMRTHYTDLFRNRNIAAQNMQDVLDYAEVMMYPTDVRINDFRIGLFRLRKYDPSKLNFMDGMRALTAIMDVEIARTPYAKGLIAIIDMTGLNLGFLKKIDIAGVARLLFYLQHSGLTLKEVHVINCTMLITQLMAIIKPFITETLNKVLFFHSTSRMNEFHQIFPKSLLPCDYGGTMQSVAHYNAELRKRLLDSKDWIKDVESVLYQVNESKRRIKSCSYYDYGVEGSFRRLNLD